MVQELKELKEQHAEELKNIQERHVVELQKLRETKNKALQEQRGLKTLLKAKEDFISDLTLDVYRYTDAHQDLEKKLKDTDRAPLPRVQNAMG